MRYYIGAFIAYFVFAVCLLIARASSNSKQKQSEDLADFLARESEANATRKKDISELPYLIPALSRLPIEAAKEHGCEKLIETLVALSQQKILNLSMYSNTDLKLMYGVANLDTLSDCDSRFTKLIRTLNDIGEVLLDESDPEALDTLSTRRDLAEQFLAYAIEIDSDITKTYVMLGNLYATSHRMEQLDKLIAKADNITSLSGPVIVNKLNSIKTIYK